eukprot:4266496-Prymnesium_polylepis.1
MSTAPATSTAAPPVPPHPDRLNGAVDAYGNAYVYNTVDPTPQEPPAQDAAVRTLRVLCIHGACLSGEIFRYSLGPIERAFQSRGLDSTKLELVFVDGLMKVETDFCYKKAETDNGFATQMAAELAAMRNWELEHVYIWGDNDDSGEHGGR